MKHDRIPVMLLALMFLTIGVMFCMNDILLPIVKDQFQLTYLQATFIQISFYIVYVIWPIPIMASIEKYGYRKNIIAAMFICMGGCLFFVPSYFFDSYAFVLLGVFTISTGVTVVNVAANPYAALLGSSEGVHVRLNFVQAFSRVGYAATPLLASYLIFARGSKSPMIHTPFIALAITISLVVLMMFIFRMPDHTPAASEKISVRRMFANSRSHRNLFLGIPTMFFYVGAEACTAGFFISLITELGHTTETAARFLTFYYILAAIFALGGAALLRIVKAGTLLGLSGIGMVACYVLVISGPHALVPYVLTAMGGFLSIMFPTVFGLAIEDLKEFTPKGSALLNFAIVGGAVFPPLQGLIADAGNIRLSYLVPAICVMVVTAYGFHVRTASPIKS
jgi:FHS family L-fucose permease-like MFS transporter